MATHLHDMRCIQQAHVAGEFVIGGRGAMLPKGTRHIEITGFTGSFTTADAAFVTQQPAERVKMLALVDRISAQAALIVGIIVDNR